MNSKSFPETLLAFIFALVDALEDGKTGFFGVGDGERLEFVGGGEAGDNFADGLFAGRTVGEGPGGQGPVQGEGATANLAAAFAHFIFVNGHN